MPHVPVSTEGRIFVRRFLAERCLREPEVSMATLHAALLPYAKDYGRKTGTGRERAVARLTVAAARHGGVRVEPMPPGIVAVAFRQWHAMAPVSGEERAEFLPPDPAFDDAVGASLGVVSLMRGSGANTYRAPGPLMIAPHALGRLHDRHGARTVDEALGALDALYRLLLTVPEAMAVRWGLERVLAEGGRSRTLLPGPRGGAWPRWCSAC
jgi:hypothetical protein